MKRPTQRPLAERLLLSTALSSAMLLSLPSLAQEQKKEEQAEIVVTGSYLPTRPDEVTSTVTAVGADQIAEEGANPNLLEILRKAIPQIAGRSNTGNNNANNNNQNTAGGSQMQLANLDTLVLIDGRRVAISAVAGVNGKNFVDINQIPSSAIDRIEVLTDGSSAIYGSDAVGGVVNVITKSDFTGGEIGSRIGLADNYQERSGYLTVGQSFGDFSIMANASAQHSDPLRQKDRAFDHPLATIPAFNVPGTIIGAQALVLAPGLTSPSQKVGTGNNATATSLAQLISQGVYLNSSKAAIYGAFPFEQYQTLLLQQDQYAGNVSFNAKLLGESLVLFGDVSYENGTARTQWLPVNESLTVPAGSPYNPLTTAVSGVDFAMLGQPKQFTDNSEAVRVTVGLKGELPNEWNWDTAFVHSENSLNQNQYNSVFQANLTRAIAGGYNANGVATAGGAYSQLYSCLSKTCGFTYVPALDPFATSGFSQAALGLIYGTEQIHTLSYINSWDAKLVGTLFQLPAGKPGFAVGLSDRVEGLAGKTDANGANSSVPGQSCIAATQNCQQWFNNNGTIYADPFNKTRQVRAAFGEIRLPLTSDQWNAVGLHGLDLISAIRTEDYTDAGWSTVPKYSFRWQPVDKQFTLRGSWSRSFTAPTLYSFYGPTQVSGAAGTILNNALGVPTTQTSFQSFTQESYGNRALRPVKSVTRSLSGTLEPEFIPHLSLTGSFSMVDERGFIGGSGVTTIVNSVNTLGSASPYFSQLSMNAFPGQPGAVYFSQPGAVKAYALANPANAANLFAADPFRNLGNVQVRTSSVAGNYSHALPEGFGELALSSSAVFFNSFKFEAPGSTSFHQYAGTATNSGAIGGTLPHYRLYSTIDWMKGNWTGTIGNTYIDSVQDEGPAGTLAPIPVKSYATVDLRLAYALQGPLLAGYGKTVTLAAGVNNVQNRMPPYAARTFTDNNADVGTYSPIGRLTYLQVSAKF
jgi:iron complex outermembrane receptor protein